MKNLIIVGAGTAGTMVANHLRHALPRDWNQTIIDPAPDHLYQPGLLFLPFGARDEAAMVRPRARTLGSGVQWLRQEVESLDTDARQVVLADGQRLGWDLLVLASGSRIAPEENEGLLGDAWQRDIHEFYTLPGAQALRERLERFEGGRLVLNVAEMPIKCPVAPLEFLFLADDFFRRCGRREAVELIYATPLDAAFTKPIAARELGGLLEQKGIEVVTEFSFAGADSDSKVIRSWDGREVPFDLLVSVPTHRGAAFVDTAGIGDELGFIPTDRATLAARDLPHTFVLGDATNLPSSKAGSVAHFQAEVVAQNLRRAIAGRSPIEGFDGHANCFVESGAGKALLIDFNYDVEPLPGTYPLPVVGPFSLLKESRVNHLGKLGFRWAYWNLLLPGRPLPVPNRMSMMGKVRPAAA